MTIFPVPNAKWFQKARLLIIVMLGLLSIGSLAADEQLTMAVKNAGCDWSKSIDVFMSSAEIYREKALYFPAIESYSCALQIDPQRTPLVLERAGVLATVGRFEQALADVQQVIGLEPHNPFPHELLAMIYFEQGRYDEALSEIDTTMAMNDLMTTCYLLRGQIYVQTGDEVKALEAFNQYFWSQKYSIYEAQAYAEIGFAYEHFGDAASAERYLRQAIALHVEVGTLYLSVAQGYRARANYPMAMENLKRAIRLKTPELASAYTERAAVYMALKDDAHALADCEALIELSPQRPEGYVCKGVVLTDMRRVGVARDQFNQAIALDKGLAAAYSGRALAELMMGEDELALADINVAIQAEPLVGNHYRIRAQIYTALKHVSGAIADYQVSLRLLGGAGMHPEIVVAIQRLEKIANV